MTAFVRIHEQRDRMIFWAIAVSLLVHAVMFLPGMRDMFAALDFDFEEEPVVVPMEFTLVSPPNQPSPTDRISKYLSTASAEASDVVETEKETEEPHGEGVIPIPDTPSPSEGAEGGGASELPPLPEPITDLGEAFEKSRFIEQSSPLREPSMPEQNPDFRNEGSARASIGGIQLNTTAWDFAPYLLDLKHRIKQHWIPPLAFTALGAIHGYTWVRFRIYPDGSTEAVEVVETEGHDSLHRSSVNAVKGAAPFRRLPSSFPEDYLEITFGFYYLLPGDEKRFFKDRQERSGP
jgi:outer membrane biosynthesis protein TonB